MTTENKEEIIFSGFDVGWRREMPVTLIFYSGGGIDLHRQTGPQFQEHIDEAAKILKKRGMILPTGKIECLGATGAYIRVVREN